LTKSLRWDIQSLGVRLAKAAAAEETSRRKKTRASSRATHEVEIRLIVQDIRKLLTRIEDAVPLINLAITTSGASLSTTLPSTVSPSRLLQASTFLTAGDTQYSINPGTPIQIGPAFTLSLYMLFAGHSYRIHDDSDSMTDTTWKEVIHKARVKLMRIPLQPIHHLTLEGLESEENEKVSSKAPILESPENKGFHPQILSGQGKQNEYAYRLEIIEDLDDGRVHSFEEDEAQPSHYGDIPLAGIREFLPIHQISKIFYADTGKILNIGAQGEANSPVLLLKRDINAQPPRRMMQEGEKGTNFYDEPEDYQEAEPEEQEDDSQDDIDQQIRRESTMPETLEKEVGELLHDNRAWRLPADLDPEWLALEVYTETDDSSSEDEQEINDDSAYVSHRPSSSGEEQDEDNLTNGIAHLDLNQNSSPILSPSRQVVNPTPISSLHPSPYGPIMSSLSLMEMLIRLTALQQFQQASHLSIPDELLTFFLEESSTTGAGGDGEERRRTRREARQKVGFDPYDESPVKRRGEDYQYQTQGQEGCSGYSRGATPYEEDDQNDVYPRVNPRWQREQSSSVQGTPEPWLLRGREVPSSSQRSTSDVPPSSPMSPYRPQRKTSRLLDRVQQDRRGVKSGSPLGRGMSVETDSTLGTSPGSPTLVDKKEKV
jgi:hypothetical protein